jgi:hypothetical protein
VQGVSARSRQKLHNVRLARGGGVREGRLRVGVARVNGRTARKQDLAVGGPPEPRPDVQGGGLAGVSGAGRARAHVDAQLAEAGEQGGVWLLQRSDQQQAVRFAAAADERAERHIREPVQALPLLELLEEHVRVSAVQAQLVLEGRRLPACQGRRLPAKQQRLHSGEHIWRGESFLQRSSRATDSSRHGNVSHGWLPWARRRANVVRTQIAGESRASSGAGSNGLVREISRKAAITGETCACPQQRWSFCV